MTGVDLPARPRHDWKPAAASDVTPRMSLVLQSFLPYPDSCLGTSPHQQGWDTKMAELSFGGIDVSKDRLDVLLLPEGLCFSVCNDAPGWAELIVRLRRLAVSAIGLEPSGGYERGIIRALFAAGLSVRRINPNKLRPNWIARLARSPYSMTLVAAGASGFLTLILCGERPDRYGRPQSMLPSVIGSVLVLAATIPPKLRHTSRAAR